MTLDLIVDSLDKTVENGVPMGNPALLPYLIGIDTRHSPGFRFENATGTPGMTLLMCFRTPAIVLAGSGLVEAAPGDCFIHKPGRHHLHYSVEGAAEGFRNDWVYFRNDLIASKMEGFPLPWDEPLRTGRPDLIEDYLRHFITELSAWDAHSELFVGGLLQALLVEMLRAGDAFAHEAVTLGDAGRAHLAVFREIRSRLLADFKRHWTVEMLAHEAFLSPERFSALYREYFSSSPISDLIEARMLCARRLLVYSGLTVKEVALESGFSDIHYFSRLFKRRNGVSPLEWRKQGKIFP